MPSTKVTAMRITWSASRKKIAASAAKMNTIAVVMPVSLRDGQVTLLVSSRTSRRNLNGLSFAMISLLSRASSPHRKEPPKWKDDAGTDPFGGMFAAEGRQTGRRRWALLAGGRRKVNWRGKTTQGGSEPPAGGQESQLETETGPPFGVNLPPSHGGRP